MDQPSERFPADTSGLSPADRRCYQVLSELAMGAAMTEALARENHHELAAAHVRAADAYRMLAVEGVGDVAEYLRLEDWHRSCARVEGRLAAEADLRFPDTRGSA
ncbi:hypothetical protein [Planobispora takensis]|uniref:Uncharacterized protein n=1 Tax=Planobispora takensis TaxID=1367882 RepID=A0A8J3T5A0_9ACTN|nr:hypothetical protein [Planobispora takensis]GII05607.1 hypothetical protein Pta02_76150 [Planobispora takensis]